jgi:hypothetical protein
MKNLFLVVSIVFFAFNSSSQIDEININTIKWGGVVKVKKHVEPIFIGEIGNELVFLNDNSGEITLQKYDKKTLLLTGSKILEFKTEEMNYLDISIIGYQPIIFTSFYNKMEKISYIYSQKVDLNNMGLNEPKVIVQNNYSLVQKTPLTKAEKKELKAKMKRELMQQVSLDLTEVQSLSPKKASLNLFTNEDNSFTFLNYGDITKQSPLETQSGLIGKLFDHNFNELNTFEYSIPFSEFEIIDTKINNNGKAFILINELKFHEKGFNEILYEHNIESTYLLTIDLIDEKSELVRIELEDRCFSEVTMKILKNGGLIIAGLTSETSELGVDELYSISYDKNMDETKVSKTVIKTDFIINSWSEQEKSAFEKENKKNKKKGIKVKNAMLFNYKVNDIIELSNGSVTVLAEQYITSENNYKHVNLGRSSLAMTTPESQPFLYNDIIAINYDQTGEYQWIKRIEKRQKSYSDFGEYSSYFAITNNNFIDIIYNQKIDPIKVQLSADGTTVIRENFIEFPENPSVIIPKKCVMINKKEFLLYTNRKSGDKIGILKF